MKKFTGILVIAGTLCLAAQALAGGVPPALTDRAAMAQLSMIEARKTMLGLCGVSGDEADKDLANDKVKQAKYEGQLSEAGKQALPDALAKIDDGVKTSWEKTPEADRTKSCDALKARMEAGK